MDDKTVVTTIKDLVSLVYSAMLNINVVSREEIELFILGYLAGIQKKEGE